MVVQYFRYPRKGRGLEADGTQTALKQLPRLDAVEDLEQHCAEEQLSRCVGATWVVLNVANQVLAHAIGCSVRVREPVFVEDRVVTPRPVRVEKTAEVDRLALGGKAPERVVNLGRRELDLHVSILADRRNAVDQPGVVAEGRPAGSARWRFPRCGVTAVDRVLVVVPGTGGWVATNTAPANKLWRP